MLEPSPPAVNDGPWFADHPVSDTGLDPAVVVSPLGVDGHTWDDAVRLDPSLAAFARDHWLANLKPFEELPSTLAETRASLTTLAFYVLAPARQHANGKIGLRWTKGGFGTPFFGDDRQVRVEGTALVIQSAGSALAEPITTLRAAGRLTGVVPGPPTGIDFHDAPPPVDLYQPLPVDPAAVAFLDDWFGFGTLVLERLLARSDAPDDTRVQLWPEHFDPAVELGESGAGQRASFGASPGDHATPLPYLYVAPWEARTGPFWNAPFGGSILTFDVLRDAPDPVEAARAYFDEARRILTA